jgi:hypothetical protein
MKKTITASILLLGISVLSASLAWGQDTTRMRDNDEMEDQDNGMQMAHQKPDCHVAFGVEAGLNMTNFLYSQNNGGITSKPLARGRAGVLLDIPIHGIFYIQPGVFYAMNGNEGNDNNTLNLNTIEVPVNAMFKFRMRHHNLLFVGAGPFVGYNVSGALSEGSFKIGSSSSDNLKAIDYGIGANVGYEFNCGLFFRARYQWGVANLQPQTNSYISTINSESYGIQAGYFFGRRAHRVETTGMKEHAMPKAWDQ